MLGAKCNLWNPVEPFDSGLVTGSEEVILMDITIPIHGMFGIDGCRGRSMLTCSKRAPGAGARVPASAGDVSPGGIGKGRLRLRVVSGVCQCVRRVQGARLAPHALGAIMGHRWEPGSME